MPFDRGLMVAGGIGQGLMEGVRAFNEGRRINIDEERARRSDEAARMGLLLQAQKEGFEFSPDGLLVESETGRAARALDKRFKESQIKENEASARSKGLLGEKTTSDQNKAGGFARRVEQAELDFQDLESSGYNRADTKSALDANLSDLPLVGNAYRANIQGENSKRQEQAERNFINAVLRRESGSAISPSEFQNAESQYFPRVGDSPKVIEQKKRNRTQVLESLKSEAGPAYNKIPLIKGGAGGGAPTPKLKPGDVVNGYRFLGGDPNNERSWSKT